MESGDPNLKPAFIISIFCVGLAALALVTFFALMIYHLLFG